MHEFPVPLGPLQKEIARLTEALASVDSGDFYGAYKEDQIALMRTRLQRLRRKLAQQHTPTQLSKGLTIMTSELSDIAGNKLSVRGQMMQPTSTLPPDQKQKTSDGVSTNNRLNWEIRIQSSRFDRIREADAGHKFAGRVELRRVIPEGQWDLTAIVVCEREEDALLVELICKPEH